MDNGSSAINYSNPEPPLEIVNSRKDDLIGGTMFSKHWLFEFLLKLIKYVDEDDSVHGKSIDPLDIIDDDSSDEDAEDGARTMRIKYKELNTQFEKDLCDLWDMSVDRNVCIELDEHNSVQIFCGYMKHFEGVYPRALEMLIGIMVNMASLSDQICLKLVRHTALIHFLLFEIVRKMADVPMVVQAVTLLNVFLSDFEPTTSDVHNGDIKSSDNKQTRRLIKTEFVNYLKSELTADVEDTDCIVNENYQEIIERLYFILEQSLNAPLLDCTTLFLFNLIDADDDILNVFAINPRFIDAICNATLTRLRLDHVDKSMSMASRFTSNRRGNSSRRKLAGQLQNATSSSSHRLLQPQASVGDIYSIDLLFNRFFLLFQTLSTCEVGAMCLASKADTLIQLFDFYLAKILATFDDWEAGIDGIRLCSSVEEESLQNLICLVSVLNSIYPSRETSNPHRHHSAFPTFFAKLFRLCKFYLDLFAHDRVTQQTQGNSVTMNSAITPSNRTSFELAKGQIKDLSVSLNVESLGSEQNSIFSACFQQCLLRLEEN